MHFNLYFLLEQQHFIMKTRQTTHLWELTIVCPGSRSYASLHVISRVQTAQRAECVTVERWNTGQSSTMETVSLHRWQHWWHHPSLHPQGWRWRGRR